MSKISSTAALPASVVFATSAVNCNVSVFCCFLSPLSGVIFAFFFRYCSWRVRTGPDRDGSFLLPFLFLFSFCFSATYLFVNARTSRKEPKSTFFVLSEHCFFFPFFGVPVYSGCMVSFMGHSRDCKMQHANFDTLYASFDIKCCS